MLSEQNLDLKQSSGVNQKLQLAGVPSTSLQKRSSIWNPLSDFWALGGLSILLCIVLHIANFFRDDLPVLQMRFMQLFAVFSILSIVCNHPHFLVSYRFGYGRGFKFIFKNWFALIVVPMALMATYAVAYFKFDTEISQSPYILSLNSLLTHIGLSFRFGVSDKLGAEIMSLSIWFMYFTVGWHYCKQVYGCMMVYAFYDGYTLKPWQRGLFKWSVVSVAIYQFIYMTHLMEQHSLDGNIQDLRFQGFSLTPIGLPEWMLGWSTLIMAILAAGGVIILILNYQKSKQLPSWNFLIPWIAFYVWWVPISHLPEYYLAMVPFFHSLQYLPFALCMESTKIKRNRWYNAQASLRILLLLAAGLLAFELIPSVIDKKLETDVYQSAWFFTSAFAVFLNIHHFFIDSVVWKLKNKDVRDSLLYETKS